MKPSTDDIVLDAVWRLTPEAEPHRGCSWRCGQCRSTDVMVDVCINGTTRLACERCGWNAEGHHHQMSLTYAA